MMGVTLYFRGATPVFLEIMEEHYLTLLEMMERDAPGTLTIPYADTDDQFITIQTGEIVMAIGEDLEEIE